MLLMKLIYKTLSYICKTTEESGIWTEKILCDIINIPFNSKRSYINKEEYPLFLKLDIENNFKNYLDNLNIIKHVGNENKYHDYITFNNKTVSLKTCISNSKICPQKIGQVSLKRFNELSLCNFKSTLEYKMHIHDNTNSVLKMYIDNLFCCDVLIYIKYKSGEITVFERQENKSVELKIDNGDFKMKNIQDWNESTTIKYNDMSLAEIQVHNKRDCLKCRFDVDTLVKLIKNEKISGIDVKTFNLTNKYNIKTKLF